MGERTEGETQGKRKKKKRDEKRRRMRMRKGKWAWGKVVVVVGGNTQEERDRRHKVSWSVKYSPPLPYLAQRATLTFAAKAVAIRGNVTTHHHNHCDE